MRLPSYFFFPRAFLGLLIVFFIPVESLAQSHVFYEHGHEITSYIEPEQFSTSVFESIWKDRDGQLWFTNVKENK